MAKEDTKEIQRSEAGRSVEPARPVRAISPFDEMERLLENAFPRNWLSPFRREWPTLGTLASSAEMRVPNIDVIDRDDQIVLRAEVPGIDKNDLEVTVSDNSVTIKGQTKREEKEEKGNYYRCEMSRGAFSRTVALPDFVNSSDAIAKFKDGVLELTMPKLEKAKRRKVKID